MISPPDSRLNRALLARTQRLVEQQLGAPCRVQVAEHALVRAAVVRRRITALEIISERVPIGDDGAHLTSLHVRLEELELQGPRLRPLQLRAGSGAFRATLTDDGLADLVDLPPVVDRVSLMGDGLRISTALGVAITCDVLLEDERIVVRPRMAPPLAARFSWASFAVGVPELPFGARLESLTVDGGEIVLHGHLEPAELSWRVRTTDESTRA